MGRNITNDELIQHKKQAIKKLNKTFETFINSPNSQHKKKADLIAYWIETYSKYLTDEERYNYSKLPRYKRGDIVSANFGFNVGSEQGGLHYAIVLDNDNKKNSKVITVVPLSSGNEEKAHERDVYLGNELHDKIMAKYEKFNSKVESELADAKRMLEVVKKSAQATPTTDFYDEIQELLDDLSKRIDRLQQEKGTLEMYKREVSKLKEGSIALMEQITTISKMRIYKPKNSHDLLYGMKFSDGAMDKINEKIQELYVYRK